MGEGVEDGEDALAKGGVGVIVPVGVDGPIDEEGPAHDGFAVNEAPVAAVGAVVAIVTHGEIFPLRDDQFVSLDVFANFVGPLDLHGRDEKLVAGRRKGVVQRIVARGGIVDDVGFIKGFAVDEDLLVDDFQPIAGQTDDALHEMRMVLIRIFEDDDVAALEVTVRQKLLVPMTASTENESVGRRSAVTMMVPCVKFNLVIRPEFCPLSNSVNSRMLSSASRRISPLSN